MQKIIDNGTTVLLADDGMMLTDDASYGTTVRLGKEADEAKWYEITAEEAEKRMNEETAEEEATEADYQDALREMGVKV
jgi:hypothetical protein